MVPYGSSWQALGSLFAEYFGMTVEFFGYFSQVCIFWLLRMDRDPAQEISFLSSRLGNVSYSGNEGRFLHIWCPEHYGELGMIDPSLLPVDPWLGCCKPGISEDHFMFSKVG